MFWQLLAQVHDEGLGIFTDEGVLRFKFLLQNNNFHSSLWPCFVISMTKLCRIQRIV